MRAVLFDLDGVLYEGDNVIDGAADAVDWFVANNIPHLFLTNTTSKPRSALVEKLAHFGINTKQDDYLTPPVAAVQLLNQHHYHDIALFVPDVTKTEFSDFTIFENENESENDSVDAVIIGDLANGWSFEKLNTAFRLLMNNPDCHFIALGMTRYWRTETGLQLDAGPFVQALAYATDREIQVTGKPASDFYNAAKNKLNVEADIVMIGDDIKGDIDAAQQAGFKAVQVRTGKFSKSDLSKGIKPDAVLDSVADLPRWWQGNMQ